MMRKKKELRTLRHHSPTNAEIHTFGKRVYGCQGDAQPASDKGTCLRAWADNSL